MSLGKIWSAFILTAIFVAAIKCFFFGQTDIFNLMVVGKADDPLNPLKIDGILQTCITAVEICIKLVGAMTFFMGIMSIAENAGGIRLLSKWIAPFFVKIFPEIPKGHPAIGNMMMNFSANFLGLDNAATPFGLKAMESLQTLNPKKDTASNAQILFLCLHASGMTLIPVSIIAVRSSLKIPSQNPTDIFIPCMIATYVATLASLILVSLKQRINLLNGVVFYTLGGITLLVAAFIFFLNHLSYQEFQRFSNIFSNGLLLFVIGIIVAGGVYKKIDVFDAFVSGAKGGFEIAIKIIPYLVGLLVAISMLRTSGILDMVIHAIQTVVSMLHLDTRFVGALPNALMKPLNGAGARALMINTMQQYGPDSFAGHLAAIFQGSSDTTFYIVAVYYSAVAIKKIRYTIGYMLLADLVGIITAIFLAYLFFGNLQ